MKRKIVVALVCHFTNDQIQKKIRTYKHVAEYAPWITSSIEGLKNYPEIELHVISPHNYLFRDTGFTDENIHYHFYTIGLPLIHRHWPHFFRLDLWTRYKTNRRKIHKLVDKINPDILHLYGAENAYYSSSILDLLNYKHLVSIQGFVYKEVGFDAPPIQKYRVKIEREISSRAENFGIECSYMKDEISGLNPKAEFFYHRIPVNIPPAVNLRKTFDIVYFGRVTRQKGVEDFIKIIGIISRKYPGLKVKIIGSIQDSYKKYLQSLINEHDCSKNISIMGFIATQAEMYRIISEAKIFLLPTYNDTIPGALVEAMFLKIAVVSYATGGIPDFNENEKTMELVCQGNINDMAEKAIELLHDESGRNELQRKAYDYVVLNYAEGKPVKELVEIYKQLANKLVQQSQDGQTVVIR